MGMGGRRRVGSESRTCGLVSEPLDGEGLGGPGSQELKK